MIGRISLLIVLASCCVGAQGADSGYAAKQPKALLPRIRVIGKTSAASRQMFQDMLGKVVQSSIDRMNSPEIRANLSKSEEFEADTDGAILAWRAGYEAWGLVAVMQRFEAASRNRYGADAGLTGHPEPLQRFKILDAALRSRNGKDTLGELGAERFQAATQGVRQRRS